MRFLKRLPGWSGGVRSQGSTAALRYTLLLHPPRSHLRKSLPRRRLQGTP